jgi:hypothetical protein
MSFALRVPWVLLLTTCSFSQHPLDVEKAPIAEYPEQVVGTGVTATVMVRVRLNRDGAVIDARTQSVRLTGPMLVSSESLIKWFSESAVAAAKRWKFNLF